MPLHGTTEARAEVIRQIVAAMAPAVENVRRLREAMAPAVENVRRLREAMGPQREAGGGCVRRHSCLSPPELCEGSAPPNPQRVVDFGLGACSSALAAIERMRPTLEALARASEKQGGRL